MGVSERDRNTFTFTWKIKNFSFCSRSISSPSFQVHIRDTDSWQLQLIPRSITECIRCCLCRNDDGPSAFLIGYELAFLSDKESTLYSVEVSKANFRSGSLSVFLSVDLETVFSEERAAFLPNDILTIQCRIWAVEGSILDLKRCFAETEIEVQRNSSVLTIERFSKLKKKRTQFLDPTSTTKLDFNFKFRRCGQLYFIAISPLDNASVIFCKCQIFLLDAAGKRIRCGRGKFSAKSKLPWIFPLTLMKRNFMKSKNQYLPSDVLTLQCEMEYSTGEVTGKIAETDYPPHLLEATDCFTPDNFLHSIENNTKTSLSWKDDLLFMFKNGQICDTVLKTSSEIIPVHSLILRIRSPVFSDMLSMDDCKSLKVGVYIEDLDANTVHKLVLYLYSDTLDDLDWKGAKNLYCASNKYQITSLKQVCASFLKNNLEPSNCCEILCMADMYQDHGLISAVQCFISKHDKEILVSDAWIKLEENNLLLAYKTLRKMYLEK